MDFRPGFKAQAEKIALEMREELGVEITAPLQPQTLAAHLSIPVLPFSGVRGVDPHSLGLLTRGSGGHQVSAVTIYVNRRRVVLYNDAQSSSRLVNSLAHELSHVLLEHEPECASVDGRRDWDGEQEREADWLSGCLLIPRGGALASAKAGHTNDEVAARYETSVQLATWRMNITGVRKQVRATAAKLKRRPPRAR